MLRLFVRMLVRMRRVQQPVRRRVYGLVQRLLLFLLRLLQRLHT